MKSMLCSCRDQNYKLRARLNAKDEEFKEIIGDRNNEIKQIQLNFQKVDADLTDKINENFMDGLLIKKRQQEVKMLRITLASKNKS